MFAYECALQPSVMRKYHLIGDLMNSIQYRLWNTRQPDGLRRHVQIESSWTLPLDSRNTDEWCKVSETRTAYTHSSVHNNYSWKWSMPLGNLEIFEKDKSDKKELASDQTRSESIRICMKKCQIHPCRKPTFT